LTASSDDTTEIMQKQSGNEDGKILVNTTNHRIHPDESDNKISTESRIRLIGRKSSPLLETPPHKKKISSATVNSHGDRTMATTASATTYSGGGISQSSSLFTHDDDDDDNDDNDNDQDEEDFVRSDADNSFIEIGKTSSPSNAIDVDLTGHDGYDVLRKSADIALQTQSAKVLSQTSRYAQYRSLGSLHSTPFMTDEDENKTKSPLIMRKRTISLANAATMSNQQKRSDRKKKDWDFLLLPEDEPTMMNNDTDAVGNNNYSYMNMFGGGGGGGRKASYNPKDENQKFMYVSTIFSAPVDKKRRSRPGPGAGGGFSLGGGFDDHFLLEDDENNSTSNDTGGSSFFDESFTSYTSVNLLPRTYPHQRYWNGNVLQQQRPSKNQDVSPILFVPNEVLASTLAERRSSLGSMSSKSRRKSRRTASLSFISERVYLDEVDSLVDDESDEDQCYTPRTSLLGHIMSNNERKEDKCLLNDDDYHTFVTTHFCGEINLLTENYMASDPDSTPRHINTKNNTATNISIDDPSLAFPILNEEDDQGHDTEGSNEYKQQSECRNDHQDLNSSCQAKAALVSTVSVNDTTRADQDSKSLLQSCRSLPYGIHIKTIRCRRRFARKARNRFVCGIKWRSISVRTRN
jgi:hypothetical protein